MLELDKTFGRQHAHDVVYEAPQASVSQGKPVTELLASDPRVTAHLSRGAIDALLNPTRHTGVSAQIAREQAEVAKRFANEVHAYLTLK
jgi:3-carboxy-cis,cis-muconate cycloisomerase